MMGFTEIEEFYHIKSKKKRPQSNYLVYYPNGKQELVRNTLPRSTGMSYYYTREYLKKLGDEPGFETLDKRLKGFEKAIGRKITDQDCIYEVIYQGLVKKTKDLE